MTFKELMPFIEEISVRLEIPVDVQSGENFTLQTPACVLSECRPAYKEWLAGLDLRVDKFDRISTARLPGDDISNEVIVIRCCPITLIERE